MSDIEFTREVTVTPAYDCTRVQPCVHGGEQCTAEGPYNHGKREAEMRLALITDNAEVSLVVRTGWWLPETVTSLPETVTSLRHNLDTMGAWLSWHSPKEIPGTEAIYTRDPERCQRGWAECWADMSGRAADKGARLLVTEGTDAVWAWLADMYREVFEEGNDE
jgi:hypothetical protein